MRRNAWSVAAAALLAAVLGGCAARSPGEGSSGPRVVAAFYPLAFVARAVGGDQAHVTDVTPPGSEPHDIELTSRQVVNISRADLLLYIGAGFQPAIEDLLPDVEGLTVDALEGQALLEGAKDPHGHADEEAEEDGDHAADPHIWLDPTRMADLPGLVARHLSDLDPDLARSYRRNAAALEHRLGRLDRAFRSGLSDCRIRSFVTSHQAFGYLAQRYDLAQIGIAGLDPEAEPAPQRIAEVAQIVREEDVGTIFFETLASERVAEAVASETGAGTDTLDPLESEPPEGDYFSAMRSNLAALRTALDCR